VFLSQLPKLFGFSTDAEGVIPESRAFVRGVIDGDTNRAALVIGLSCLAVIFACKWWWPKFPGVLIAVVGATAAVGVFSLAERHDVAVVGSVPRGLPAFEIRN
jgi:MFS superfamily sulfate permease-like transporter